MSVSRKVVFTTFGSLGDLHSSAWLANGNPARVARLGVARVLPRRRYTASRIAAELRALLRDPSYATRAAEVGQRLQGIDGAAVACDALEALLRR
jgi:rhamnosyltransferase subunit B